MGQEHIGLERDVCGLEGDVEVVAQGAEPRPQVEDQGRFARHLDQDAGGVSPVATVLVGRARARSPHAEVGDSHRRSRLAAAPARPRSTLRDMDQHTVNANGVEFAYLGEGPEDGPLALCLHGFPDTPHTWRHLLPRLADAGYHAVAPYLRGYAPTSVPEDGRYDTGTLALDACALHEALGGDGDAVIIGHDWGAMMTYGGAAFQPDRWRIAVTATVPPQRSMGERFFAFDQLHRSWYIFFFQTALAAPESLGAAIGYYRAMFAGPPDDPEAAAAQAFGSGQRLLDLCGIPG